MIDAELGDENDPNIDTSFNVDELEDMSSVPPATLNKKIPKDDLEDIVKDELKNQTKALADEKRKQRLALKREMQDETIKRNIQTKLDKRSAYDRRNQLRASAVSQRIQAYSIASSLGFAGYVAASIVDQFVIRPKEKEDIAAEDKYNADYAAYEQYQKDDQLQRRRAREDEISGLEVDEPAIRDNIFNGKPQPTSFTPKVLDSPLESKAPDGKNALSNWDYQSKLADFAERQNKIDARNNTPMYEAAFYKEANDFVQPSQDPKYTGRGEERTRDKEFSASKPLDENGEPLRIRTGVTEYPQQTPLKNNPNRKTLDQLKGNYSQEQLNTERQNFLDNNAPTLEAPPRDKAAETQKTVDKVTKVAEVLKPVAPTSTVSFIEKNGPIGLAIAAGITAAQMGNQKIEEIGKGIGSLGKDVLTGSTTTGLATIARTARGTIDPLGINPLAQVSVTGFETLLSLTESIKSYAEKDKEFSPLTLQASIEGDIARLMQSIELAQKNDPLKAQFTEVYAQLDLVWNEFKAEVFQNIAPAIIGALNILVAGAKVSEGSFSLAAQVAKHSTGWFGTLIQILEAIQQNTAPDPGLNFNVLKEVADFLKPGNQDLPQGMFAKKPVIPNQVP